MYDMLDSSIKECEYDDINAANEWYDVVIDIATKYLDKLQEDDWKKLFDALPQKSVIWKKRLCDCLMGEEDNYRLKALLIMANTDDIGLFSMVISCLTFYDASSIENIESLYKKVEQNIDKVQGYYQEKFREFLEKKNRVR